MSAHLFIDSITWDSSPEHLTYHIEADDLTVGLLDLPELSQEVPEPRLGHDRVRRKDAHAVELGRGVGLGGQVTPDDLVLGETPYKHSSQPLIRSMLMLCYRNERPDRCVDCVRHDVDDYARSSMIRINEKLCDQMRLSFLPQILLPQPAQSWLPRNFSYPIFHIEQFCFFRDTDIIQH